VEEGSEGSSEKAPSEKNLTTFNNNLAGAMALTENVTSPFQAEPAQFRHNVCTCRAGVHSRHRS
jgi:hypothetical protein